MIEHLVDLAIEIQQIPAPTFGETERGEFIRAKFAELHLAHVSQGALGMSTPGCRGGTARRW
jgi:hypothetical protein